MRLKRLMWIQGQLGIYAIEKNKNENNIYQVIEYIQLVSNYLFL